MISKTFGKIPQYIVHEDNSACLKDSKFPKISPQTKHISIPYHFFRTNIGHLETKVRVVSTDNKVANRSAKVLSEQKFRHERFVLTGW